MRDMAVRLVQGTCRARMRPIPQQQAANHSGQQFSASPDLKPEVVNAVMSALDPHTAMSTQALNSPAVRRGPVDSLLQLSVLYTGCGSSTAARAIEARASKRAATGA